VIVFLSIDEKLWCEVPHGPLAEMITNGINEKGTLALEDALMLDST